MKSLLFVCASLAVLTSYVHATFVELTEIGAGLSIPCAWGDYDGDGDPDLAVGNLNQPNRLYVNNGDGTFTETAAFGTGATFAVSWADADNDGDLDLAVGNGQGGQNYLYRNDGAGSFAELARFGMSITNAVAWADYDRDGDLDLAVGNGLQGANQQNYLYRNDGGLVFAELAMFGARQSASMVWGDANGDGHPDMAVGNGGYGFNQNNRLFVNNGDGTFTGTVQFSQSTDTACLSWGDADNDGDLDMAVMNWDAQQNYLYRNDGGLVFAEIAMFGARDPNTCAWGDADLDGDLDLAVGNGDFTSAEQNYLYRNDGAGAFAEIAAFGTGSTDGVAWADYDGDGDLDLASINEHTPTQNYLYRNDQAAGDWIAVKLTGHFHDTGVGYSNRDGIGARVSVFESGFLGDPAHLLGFREKDAHGGFSSQNDGTLHFGIPGESSVDVRIVWPGSGGTQITQNVLGAAAGQVHAIEEAGAPTGVLPAGQDPRDTFRIVTAPNPSASSVHFYVDGASVSRGTANVAETGKAGVLEIFALSGRRVARLPLLADGNGVLRGAWDGRADSGDRAGPGVYFARIAGESTHAKRFVILH